MRAGTSRYYKEGDIYRVRSVATHPIFSGLNYDFDVGLVQVKREIFRLIIQINLKSNLKVGLQY